MSLASQGKPYMLQTFSIKTCFDFTNLGADLESIPRAPRWRKMSFILGKFNDISTCKLHLSLPATQRHVVCLSHCTSGGLASEGKHPLLDNLSIKTFI